MSNPSRGEPGDVMLTTGGGMRGVEGACVGVCLRLGGLSGRLMGVEMRIGALSSLPMSRLARAEDRCGISKDRLGVRVPSGESTNA